MKMTLLIALTSKSKQVRVRKRYVRRDISDRLTITEDFEQLNPQSIRRRMTKNK